MSFLQKNCLRLQNLQGYRETELRQLGVIQWHHKKGIIWQMVFLEERKNPTSIPYGQNMPGSQGNPYFGTQFWPYFDDLATFALRRAILHRLKIKV